MKVTLLGTGAPAPRMDRFGPGILIEAGNQTLLFDCGRGVTQRIEQLKVPFADVDEKLPAQGVVVHGSDITQDVVYENGGLKVTAFDVDHGPVKPALGYRIDLDSHSVVLSGDTRPSENLIHFSAGTDVLIHEVIDPVAFSAQNPSENSERIRRVTAHHTTPQEAGTVFARVQPRLAIYSHIVPGAQQT